MINSKLLASGQWLQQGPDDDVEVKLCASQSNAEVSKSSNGRPSWAIGQLVNVQARTWTG